MTFTEFQNIKLGKRIRVEYEPVNLIYTVFQDEQKLSMTTQQYLKFRDNLTKYEWTQVPFSEVQLYRAA